jgi:hypothetical protein
MSLRHPPVTQWPRLPLGARATYNAQGYFIGKGLIAHRYVDAFLHDLHLVLTAQITHHELQAQPGAGLESIYGNLVTLHRHDQEIYLATLRVFSRLRSLYELFLSESVEHACSDLGVTLAMQHTLPLLHVMSNNLRIDSGYHGFDPHQDWTGLQTSLNTVVVWVPCHDIGLDGFPLEVLPRSHRQGLCRGALADNDYKLDPSCWADRDFVPLEACKGDVVFMSPFTIHRTGQRGGSDLRVAVSWRYEDALEETFVDRGYPFAQAKLVRHALQFPEFPTPDEMRRALK